MDTYEGATVALSFEQILLYNAVVAFGYLAHRAGTRPDERSCGRTLAEDVSWCE